MLTKNIVTPLQSYFLFLLRTALWRQVPTFPKIDEAEWKEIVKIGKEQTVIGLLADVVTSLPAELRPSLSVVQQIVPLVLSIERQNYRMEQVLGELLCEFHQIGIYPILMKGQSVGRRYLHPEHRVCGDIDLLFTSTEDLQRANEGSVVKPSCKPSPSCT